MGPVPADFDLSSLEGRQLNQVCIGPFDLQFRFDSEHRIGCEGRVIVECDGDSVVSFDRKWLDATPLTKIVGRDVIGWRIETSHEFSITLSGGAKIRFISADSQYEDFNVLGWYF